MRKINISLAVLALLSLSSCGESEKADKTAVVSEPWQPGIYSAERQGDGVVLRVVLRAEKKMQFYVGERRLAKYWTHADSPTEVFIVVREGGLVVGNKMTSSTDSLQLGELVLSDEFADSRAGVNDIILGWLDGQAPFGVQLIPTTAAEAEAIAIENHERVRGAALRALPTPENAPEHTASVFMEAIRDGDMSAAVAWTDDESGISLDNRPQAVFHKVIGEFLAECKKAEIDTLAKMEKQLGLDVLREREQEGEDTETMDRSLWHPVLREIERRHERHPYEAIRKTYIGEPSPYRQEAILLLKVMGDESPEIEAFRHIIGPLGLSLGEFMIIEGRPCAVGKGGEAALQSLEEISKFGVHSLEVQKVNGTELKAPVIIQIAGNAKFNPAAYYVVRGYQTAEFGPNNPAPEDTNATVPQTDHQLQFRFQATTVMEERQSE